MLLADLREGLAMDWFRTFFDLVSLATFVDSREWLSWLSSLRSIFVPACVGTVSAIMLPDPFNGQMRASAL